MNYKIIVMYLLGYKRSRFISETMDTCALYRSTVQGDNEMINVTAPAPSRLFSEAL